MNGQISISYRHDDAAGYAGRLYDHLHDRFPQNEICINVDVAPGTEPTEAHEKNVRSCDVLIAVIGHRWLSASDEEEKRRLNSPEDLVRIEIGTALKRGIRVIPVLVEGALMPRSGELPDELKALVRRRAFSVRPDRFQDDSERLISAVKRALKVAGTQQQRKRAEQERVNAERRERADKEEEQLRAEHYNQERLELERQQETQARLRAEQQLLRADQERLEAERREHEEGDRLEAQRQEWERQHAEAEQWEIKRRRQEEREQERLRVEQRQSLNGASSRKKSVWSLGVDSGFWNQRKRNFQPQRRTLALSVYQRRDTTKVKC
jgi:hypothetical protein